MKQLHNAQDAIEQAIEGGWDGVAVAPRGVPYINACLDPLFWQSLGKARGWKPGEEYTGTNYESSYRGEWFYQSLNWFENRMVCGDEKTFWESLP